MVNTSLALESGPGNCGEQGRPSSPANRRSILGVLCSLALASALAAQAGTVRSEQKTSATAGGFGGLLDAPDAFGVSVASLGDLDGDGVGDLAVGASRDDDGGFDQGAVWILFLDTDGTVKSEQKISETEGGFSGILDDSDLFGFSVAAPGDVDGDGIGDLAVGAIRADDGGSHQDSDLGAVWILFLDTDGTVKSEQKISATTGGFGGVLDDNDFFGLSVASLGDLDQDGNLDLAVGSQLDDDGGSDLGAVWILFLDTDGTVKSEQKISATEGGFGGVLDGFDHFGSSLAPLGDMDGDATQDLAVGAIWDDDGGGFQGAVWVLFLETDGTVKNEQKISATEGGFNGSLDDFDYFGWSVAALGDLDDDGIGDLAVGALNDDDGGSDQGAVWVLFLEADGTVKSEQKISATAGGFGGDLDPSDNFGSSLASLGDLDGDGVGDLVAGAAGDDDGGFGRGAVWILFLEDSGEGCAVLDFETEDDLATPLVNGQHIDTEFGTLVTITCAGANAGAGIFDSTLGGPNDPSQDLDLLVNTGNLLILQTENYPPDANDIFPRPNDDEDGGTLSFSFPAEVEARSLRLVDIDASDGTSQVILSDSSGRRRTYSVPGGWTGDRTLSQPGQGTLDLLTLGPQPGFGSTAMASEEPGFDAGALVRLDVRLAGSGAVDDVAWCTGGSGVPHASATVRNGTGVNPRVLSDPATPVLGGTWVAGLDCRGHTSGLAILVAASLPVTIPTGFGEVLIGGPRLLRWVRPHTGSVVSFTQSIPDQVGLIGLDACVQGVCTGGGVSLTNALDLVLGF